MAVNGGKAGNQEFWFIDFRDMYHLHLTEEIIEFKTRSSLKIHRKINAPKNSQKEKPFDSKTTFIHQTINSCIAIRRERSTSQRDSNTANKASVKRRGRNNALCEVITDLPTQILPFLIGWNFVLIRHIDFGLLLWKENEDKSLKNEGVGM